MLVFHDSGKIEYIARGVSVEIAPAAALTQAQRDALRPLIALLRADGRAQVRAALTAAAADLVP